MKLELVYLTNADAIALSAELEAKQEARIKALFEMGAKTVEGIIVEGSTFWSVLNGQD